VKSDRHVLLTFHSAWTSKTASLANYVIALLKEGGAPEDLATMTSNGDGMSSYYPPQKRQRKGVKIEAKASPDPLSRPSFPVDLLESFSFKAKDSSKQSYAELRRSTRKVSDLSSTSVKAEEETLLLEERKEEKEHLPEVKDYVKEGMDILIIGSNPGRMSSRKGQHFSHPSNHFYRALHRSGLTPTQVPPSLDYTMLNQTAPHLSIGLTNLVARPTRMAQELKKTEEALGTEILIDLIRRYRPKVGLFIGIGVARAFERSLAQLKLLEKKTGIKKEDEGSGDAFATIKVSPEVPINTDKTLGFGVGLMQVGVRHSTGFTLLFAMPSTSGRVTTHQLKEKTACMVAARILTSELDIDSRGDRQDVTIRLI
jgi:G:T/U-mismatch repair DNA glycosylase